MAGLHPVYVSYEEAQRLIPTFQLYAKEGQWKDLRHDSKVILSALRDVHPGEYELGGMQIFLSERQAEFVTDVRGDISRPA